jgi:aminotransferase
VHDFLTVGAAAPLQQAGVLALGWGQEYYGKLSGEYTGRRAHILETLEAAGFKSFVPHGAYYVMTDISGLGFSDDLACVRYLIETLGVAAVPGSSFYAHPMRGAKHVRFCFCKKYETLEVARQKLKQLRSR